MSSSNLKLSEPRKCLYHMYLDGTSAPLCESIIITVTRCMVPVHSDVDFLGVAV